MTERVSTGIPLLDKDLDGGFPTGSTVLVIGDKNTGVHQLANYFIYKGHKENNEDLYITLSQQPSSVKDNSKHYGWDLSKDQLTFVDGYSWQMDEPESPFSVTGLSDMNEISMTVIDALNSMSQQPNRTVINSVTTLLNYMNTSPATRLTKVISSKTNKGGGVTLLTMYDSVHEDQTKAKFKNIADGVILLKKRNNTVYLGIDQMRKTDLSKQWRKLEINSKNGLNLKK